MWLFSTQFQPCSKNASNSRSTSLLLLFPFWLVAKDPCRKVELRWCAIKKNHLFFVLKILKFNANSRSGKFKCEARVLSMILSVMLLLSLSFH